MINKKVYIEAGAYDGNCGSPSLQFANDDNFFGILVEPSSSSYQLCVQNRSNANTVIYNCALVPFTYTDTTIKLQHHHEHPGMHLLSTTERYEKLKGQYPDNAYEVVQARTLQSILDEHGIAEIEYFFLDVEGAEKDVLQGIDLTRVRINNIEIENHYSPLDTLHGIMAPEEEAEIYLTLFNGTMEFVNFTNNGQLHMNFKRKQ